MKTFALFLASIAAGLVSAQKPDLGDFIKNYNEHTGRNGSEPVESSFNPGLRISGGSDVNPRFKYPFMTFIRIDGYSDAEYLCGGTLLDGRTLLTSAHCVTSDYVNYFTAFVHRHNKKLATSRESGSEHRFSKVIAHEKYSNKGGVSLNDIALVRLKTPTKNMKFVRLPNPKLGDPPSDVELTITGWGLTKSKGAQSNNLEEALKLHTTQSCFTKIKGLSKSKHICAIGRLSADACTNDSGGPLLAPATDDGYIQVGIITAGVKCGASNLPGVYTRILGQLTWISNARKRL